MSPELTSSFFSKYITTWDWLRSLLNKIVVVQGVSWNVLFGLAAWLMIITSKNSQRNLFHCSQGDKAAQGNK